MLYALTSRAHLVFPVVSRVNQNVFTLQRATQIAISSLSAISEGRSYNSQQVLRAKKTPPELNLKKTNKNHHHSIPSRQASKPSEADRHSKQLSEFTCSLLPQPPLTEYEKKIYGPFLDSSASDEDPSA